MAMRMMTIVIVAVVTMMRMSVRSPRLSVLSVMRFPRQTRILRRMVSRSVLFVVRFRSPRLVARMMKMRMRMLTRIDSSRKNGFEVAPLFRASAPRHYPAKTSFVVR